MPLLTWFSSFISSQHDESPKVRNDRSGVAQILMQISLLLEEGYLGSQEDQLLVKMYFLTVVFQKGVIATVYRAFRVANKKLVST